MLEPSWEVTTAPQPANHLYIGVMGQINRQTEETFFSFLCYIVPMHSKGGAPKERTHRAIFINTLVRNLHAHRLGIRPPTDTVIKNNLLNFEF